MVGFKEAFAFIDRKDILLLFVIFLAGFMTASIITAGFVETPGPVTGFTGFSGNGEIDSPKDWIPEKDIHVYKDRIIIDLQDAEWATFTDTNSMDPVFDFGSNALEIIPDAPEQITPGEIVSYQSKYASGTIVHRVAETGYDEDGWYAVMKGDNNPAADPERVRFSQIQRLVVAIIY